MCLLFWLLLAAMLTAALTSFVIGYPTLRLKGDYFAIATLGFAEAVRLIDRESGKDYRRLHAVSLPSIPIRHCRLPSAQQ